MVSGSFKTYEVLSPKKNSTVIVGSFDVGSMIYSNQVVLKKLHGSATEVEQEMENCRFVQKLATERGGNFCEIIAMGSFESIGSWVPTTETSICMLKYDMDLETLMRTSEAFDFTPKLVESFCASVCCTMQLLHEMDMMHLDIKPQNLLWKYDTPDKLFLCDFGSMASPATLTNQHFIGTVPYASPEQFRQSNVNKSSDVWAFGCILMQMLSRQHPWQGENNNYKVYIRISDGQIPFVFNNVTCQGAGEDKHSVLMSKARACLQHNQQLRPTFVTLNEDIGLMSS
jgi:serine/threonine protein kinase